MAETMEIQPQETETHTPENTADPVVDEKLVSITGREAPTEAELRGEQSESVKESDTAHPSDEPAEEKQEEEVKDEESEEPVTEDESEESDEESEEESEEDDIPPEIEQQVQNLNKAVHQERKRAAEFKKEAQQLKSEVALLREQLVEAEESKLPPFETLTEEEEIELAETDPAEYAKYLRSLRVHQEHEKQAEIRKAQEQAKLEATRAKNQAVVQSVFTEIDAEIPGIYDSPEYQEELAEVAVASGLDPEYTAGLSDPGTLVMFRDPETKEYTQPQLLAEGAKGVVMLLAQLRESAIDPKDIQKEIEDEIRKDEREKVTKMFKEKLKGNDKQIFASLGDVPASGETPKPRQLSRAELARLTDEERDAYLAEI